MSDIQPTMHSVRMELFEATPAEVWREYFDNGYTWAKAVNEELSYAEAEDEKRDPNAWWRR